MKQSYEYKLIKKEILIYLIVWFLVALILGILTISDFSEKTPAGNIGGTIGLVTLLVFSILFMAPLTIHSLYNIFKLRSFDKEYEVHIVKFDKMHTELAFGFYFSFDVTLNSGTTVTLETKRYFRTYGARNINYFLNKDVEIAYSPKSNHAVVMKKPIDKIS